MSRLVRWGLSVLTMTSVATVLLLVTGWGSAIASSVSSVVVTNSAANAVPVHEQNVDKNGYIAVHEQGTAAVHEQGTANVNVTSATTLPVHEQGTAEVASANDEVRAVGGCDSGPSGGPNCSTDVLYTVPAGEEFVLEYLGAQAIGANSSNGAVGEISAIASSGLPLDLQPVATSGSVSRYEASDQVHFSYPPGTPIVADVFAPGATEASLSVEFGGYLQPTR